MMTTYKPNLARRELLRGAFGGASLSLARRLGLPFLFSQAALVNAADQRYGNRILVIFELSGGNDGLNTVVPTRTTHTIGPVHRSASKRRRCAKSTTISASA